jgi:hypothetical protein
VGFQVGPSTRHGGDDEEAARPTRCIPIRVVGVSPPRMFLSVFVVGFAQPLDHLLSFPRPRAAGFATRPSAAGEHLDRFIAGPGGGRAGQPFANPQSLW